MSVYVDTSVLVSALTREADTENTVRWLSAMPPGSLAISEWVTAEFASALALMLRNRTLVPEARAHAQSAFARLRMESLEILDIEAADFRMAAQFAGQPGVSVRAADALHLAIARRHAASLATLDKQQAAAAGDLGMIVLEL